MAWSQVDIANHVRACNALNSIKDDAFRFISRDHSVNERDVQEYILGRFKELDIATTDRPIVAFNENASDMHYMPKKDSKQLSENTLIMIDIWGRLKKDYYGNKIKQPYSDITWMGYTGKLTDEQKKVCGVVFDARDLCIQYLRWNLSNGIIPTGQQVDLVARKFITDNFYGPYFLHTTGHSIGYASCHGKEPPLKRTNRDPLVKELGYTIEPGIYLKGRFGVRSEIDFYITKENNLVITTPVQKELIKI